MPASADLLTLALATLALAGVLALALSVLAILWRGRPRGRAKRDPARRHWSHDDLADRMRTAYFAKERKARALRERERLHRRVAQEAATGPEAPPVAPPLSPEAPHRTEAHYRAVLELEGEITEAGVRRAYLRLIAAYHPDKVAGLGAKLQALAEEETKRINEAYAFFRRRYGF